ncbi:MAG TPA: endo-1,4-beta-xylanase [Rhizomicrobium sp.]|jgi:endo-1,4-beta-xylanase|nr:endo-1,4-beta-xylanase [Rhizomicrobium sp.]
MTSFSRRETPYLALAAAATAALPLPAAARAGTAPESLNGLAAAKGLRFGSCLGTGPSGAPLQPGVTAKRADQFDDPALRALFVRECGILVPENELKWYAIRPDATTFDFARADTLMAFVADNGLLVRGHTLLWNRDEWMPAWIKTYDFGPRPGTEAARLLTEHITTVCRRYPQIFAWDVVNETIDPKTGGMTESVFTRYIGPEVIDIAFQAARAAAPHAQLVYNDYMSWGPGNAKHRAGVLALLERLKEDGVPIDALGVQAHIGPGASASTVTLDGDNEAEWRKFLDAATAAGLDLVITEFDYGDQTLPPDIALRDAAVASATRHYLDVMLSYRQLRYVMAWGLVDKYSWLRERLPRADGLPKRPNPYDDDYRPKKLRAAIADAFRAAPVRPWLT